MIDREGRIVFGSLLVFVVALTGSNIAEHQFGASLHDHPVLSFLVFGGIAVVGPQLYLAATEEEPWSRERIQFVTVATAVFATLFAADASGIWYLVLAFIGACSLFALVCYEVLRWHRMTVDEVRPAPTDP
ncbi:hypothetical protein [Natronorubrum sp. DTA28]|uniref:hypothetical protein n=1 Tax=Natronorubrum sp. DTA28 TaxID=3447019 RepID=UPI003F839211